MDLLSPDTNLALMQASQSDPSKASKNLQNAKKLEKVETAAKEFEAVFMTEMMKPMFEGIKTEAPFGGGKGEEVFQGFLLQEYGKLLSQTGEIGLSGQVKDQMIKMQEQADQNYKLSRNTTTEGRDNEQIIPE